MCGIAGIYKTGRISAEDVAAVLRMNDAQTQRGPDDWGLLLPEDALANEGVRELLASLPPEHILTYSSASAVQVVLGSRRLSIIDLSRAGRMPMASDDHRVFITFNGEVYNHHELREELKHKGCVFKSASDTEVILKGYETWGEDVVRRLRGMFGFAVLDLRQSVPRLMLVKDRFGIKQVYYSQANGRLLFASEFLALMKSGLVAEETSAQALITFLQLGSLAVPNTFDKNISALPAGNLLKCEGESLNSTCYWDLEEQFQSHSENRSESVPSVAELGRRLRPILEQTVRQHLISDVPLGVFLSGGIDSSSLVALASMQQNSPLTTISINFEEERFSEQRFARMIADQYHTDHHEITVSKRDFYDDIPRMFRAMDQPTVDGVNTYVVSKAARGLGVKVVLSGTGGDEIFLGYSFFSKINSLTWLRSCLKMAPSTLRNALAGTASGVGRLLGRTGMEKLGYLTEPSATNIYLLLRGLFAPAEIQQLLGMSSTEFKTLNPIPVLFRSNGSNSLLEEMIFLDFKHYLGNQLLKDMDSMSMAHSLETRVPFLDHVLAEEVLKIPAAARLGNGIVKPLLVSAMGRDLPEAIWNRPKMGFTFPFDDWMRQDSMELEERCVNQSVLDSTAVKNIWRGFREGRYHWSRPWALLVLSHWVARRESTRATAL